LQVQELRNIIVKSRMVDAFFCDIDDLSGDSGIYKTTNGDAFARYGARSKREDSRSWKNFVVFFFTLKLQFVITRQKNARTTAIEYTQ